MVLQSISIRSRAAALSETSASTSVEEPEGTLWVEREFRLREGARSWGRWSLVDLSFRISDDCISPMSVDVTLLGPSGMISEAWMPSMFLERLSLSAFSAEKEREDRWWFVFPVFAAVSSIAGMLLWRSSIGIGNTSVVVPCVASGMTWSGCCVGWGAAATTAAAAATVVLEVVVEGFAVCELCWWRSTHHHLWPSPHAFDWHAFEQYLALRL